jgi:hypothetical protein
MTNTYFVFGSNAHIAWNAFPLMPQTLVFSETKKTDKAVNLLHRYNRSVEFSGDYEIKSSCSVKNSIIAIKFLAGKTEGKLQVIAGDQVLPSTTEDYFIGDEKVSNKQAVYVVKVNRENFPIKFRNTDPTSAGSQIKIYPVERPEESQFTIADLSNAETGYSPASGGEPTPPFKITAQPGATKGDFVFVTTDKAQPVIRLKLEPQ